MKSLVSNFLHITILTSCIYYWANQFIQSGGHITIPTLVVMLHNTWAILAATLAAIHVNNVIISTMPIGLLWIVLFILATKVLVINLYYAIYSLILQFFKVT